MRDVDERRELLLEGVDLRPERGDPVRLEGLAEQLELAAGLVRGREIDARHCDEPNGDSIITSWLTARPG